jgi:hypothetical protein
MTLRSLSRRAKAALGASLLALVAVACDEDGETTPEACPPLEIFDIQHPGNGGEGGEATNPCVTPIGHAISPSAGTGGTSTAGKGGMATSSDAGAGGA